MATFYELIDFASGNLVGSYATRDEALEIVRRAVDDFGWSGVAGLGLMSVEESGPQELIAAEADLAELAGTSVLLHGQGPTRPQSATCRPAS